MALPKMGAQRDPRTAKEMLTSFRRLPKSGRKGKLPPWPLDDQVDRERRLWERIWRTPQAVAWEELGWTDQVARYVRIEAMAELGDIRMLPEARQMEDRLGLSSLALLRLRWMIVDDIEEKPAPGGTIDITRRLKAVE